jgi:hypothetical protein
MWRALNSRIDFTHITDMDGELLTQRTRIRPISFYSHGGDFMFIDWQRNKEVVQEGFDLFDRLNVPAGDYEFDRVRAEISTGMQRPINVVLSVQDGGFFGGDRLEKFVELQWRQSAYFFIGLRFTENDVDLPFGVNSRVRYIPEAGREMVFVVNHGGTVDPLNHFMSTQSDINLKVSYTFRY